MSNLGLALVRILVSIALWAAWAGQAAGATAGAFQFVAGEVRVILAAGSERPASKGSPVEVGDTIATSRNSMAQIKLGDGAIVVVQPESRVTVAEYHYSGAEDGTEQVKFRLEQGGMRALTGAIGHTHKGNYSIETPIAHIGVRGTDHESYYFPAGRDADVAPGVYNKVNTGLTFIRTGGGEVEIPPNQVGFAGSAQDLPTLLATIPDFFNRSIQPKAVQHASTPVAASPRHTADPQVVQTVTTTNGVNLSDPQFASLVGYTGPAAGGEGMGVSFGHSGVNLGISSNGGTLVNAGGDPKFGVNWGSWQGGVATVNGLATTGSTHFINSIDPTSATQLASLGSSLVSATYTYDKLAGTPAPTNQLGTQGTINSLSVGVNFSTQSITNYAVNVSIPANPAVGATTWNATGSGTISQFTGASGIALMGTCSGCNPGAGTPAAQGTANGAFVGGAAEKMITSFGLKAATQAIAGVGYLSR
jgi:hypothetical protein